MFQLLSGTSFVCTDWTSSGSMYNRNERVLSGPTEFHLDRVLSRRPALSVPTAFQLDRVIYRPNFILSTKFYLNRPSFISTEFYLIDQVLSAPTEFNLDRVLSCRPSFIWTDRVSSRPSYISTEFYLDRPSFISSTKFYVIRPSWISAKLYLDRVFSRRPSFIWTNRV